MDFLMLNPVDPITWLYGAWGAAFLLISARRREWIGVELGVAMLSTWAVSAWALMALEPEPAFYVTTFYDAVVGIGLALWMTAYGRSRRGVALVVLFIAEMLVRLAASQDGFWNVDFCYATECAIYALQVAIGGWCGLLDTIADWRSLVRYRRHHPAHRS